VAAAAAGDGGSYGTVDAMLRTEDDDLAVDAAALGAGVPYGTVEGAALCAGDATASKVFARFLLEVLMGVWIAFNRDSCCLCAASASS